MADNTKKPLRRCSFCGRSEEQVGFLIPSPLGAYICDNCVFACEQIIDDYHSSESDGELTELAELPKPKEIKAFLLPNLSLNAPINKVVNVAAAALAATIAGMKL